MPVFIANENGDWWRFEPEDVLYILDTHNLPDEIAKEWGYLNEDGTPNENSENWADDSLIWEYGEPIPQSKLIDDYSIIDNLLEQINHLQAVIRELRFAKKGE